MPKDLLRIILSIGYILNSGKKIVSQLKIYPIDIFLFRGRKPIDIDDTKLYEVWKKYKSKQITLEQAVTLLNISVSTFHRKTKKFAE